MKKNKVISIVGSIIIIGATSYALMADKTPSQESSQNVQTSSSQKDVNNVIVKDGVQYVTVLAKGGYSPKLNTIKANMPTKLVIKTEDTYDCSSSLVIRSLSFQKVLKATGEETIDVGKLATGEKLQGVCGMGMYNFQVVAS